MLRSLLLATPLLVSCLLSPSPPPENTPIPAPNPVSQPAISMDSALPQTVHNRVQLTLATYLNIPIDQVHIGRHRSETWSDGCLGLGGPAESCLAALTDGWYIEAVDTQTNTIYRYRTDLSANQVRLEP